MSGACRCDGGSYEVRSHPFLVHPDCPVHSEGVPVSGDAATELLREALADWLRYNTAEPNGDRWTDRGVTAAADALLPLVEAECRRRAAEAAPVLCPKCQGQGVVSRPPWVPADLPTWSQPTTAPYRCNLCEGRMVIRADAIEGRP